MTISSLSSLLQQEHGSASSANRWAMMQDASLSGIGV